MYKVSEEAKTGMHATPEQMVTNWKACLMILPVVAMNARFRLRFGYYRVR